MISRKLEKYVCTSWLSRRGSSCSDSLRVAGDVEEEHGDLDVLLLQLGGVGILLEQPLHRLGHELRQLALELLEQLQTLRATPGGSAARVASSVFLRSSSWWARGQPARHVVEGRAELADLVAAAHGRPRLEVALADPAGRRRQLRRSGGSRRGAWPRCSTAAAATIVSTPIRIWRLRWRRTSAKHRLHRGVHAHHRAHLVVAAVAALALLLVQRSDGAA